MKELHDLETYEVSLVPKGANGKNFLIFKNFKGEQGMKDAKEILDWVTKNVDAETMKKVQAVIKDLGGAQLAPAHEGAMEEPHIDVPLDDRAKAALQAIARIASPMKDSLHPGHLVKVLQAAGYDMSKAMAPAEQPAPAEEGAAQKDHMLAIPMEVLSDMKDVLKTKLNKSDDDEDEDDEDDELFEKAIKGHMDEAMGEAQKAYKSHLEKLGYRKYPDAEVRMKSLTQKDLPKQVDVSEENHEHGEAQSMEKNVLKSLDLTKVDPKVKTALEAVFKANEVAVAKAAKLETELKAERETRREKEFVEKAAKLEIGAKTEDLAKILKSVADVNPELATGLETILKAAGEQIKKGKLFEEIGSATQGKIAGDDAWSKIEAMASGMVEKSAGKVSKADAIEAVLKTDEGNRLYGEYMASKPGMKV